MPHYNAIPCPTETRACAFLPHFVNHNHSFPPLLFLPSFQSGGQLSYELLSQAHIESAERALDVCERLGYPAMIKASAGGGGKGIRKVYHKDEVVDLYRAVVNEVKGSLIFIMKLITRCRWERGDDCDDCNDCVVYCVTQTHSCIHVCVVSKWGWAFCSLYCNVFMAILVWRALYDPHTNIIPMSSVCTCDHLFLYVVVPYD